MVNKFVVCLAVVAITTSGCTWIKPSEGAKAIALVKPGVVQDCKRLGKSEVSVKRKVGFLSRSDSKIAEELLTLAENAAVGMQADTIVAESDVSEDGQQTFGLYRCR